MPSYIVTKSRVYGRGSKRDTHIVLKIPEYNAKAWMDQSASMKNFFSDLKLSCDGEFKYSYQTYKSFLKENDSLWFSYRMSKLKIVDSIWSFYKLINFDHKKKIYKVK